MAWPRRQSGLNLATPEQLNHPAGKSLKADYPGRMFNWWWQSYAAESKRFVPVWLSCAIHMINRIQPITGIIHSNCNQPLRLVSCKRRAPTAKCGNMVARENKPPSMPEWFTIFSAADAKNKNSTNHQYSERLARPLKSAYLLKQVLIDSVKFIVLPFE